MLVFFFDAKSDIKKVKIKTKKPLKIKTSLNEKVIKKNKRNNLKKYIRTRKTYSIRVSFAGIKKAVN